MTFSFSVLGTELFSFTVEGLFPFEFVSNNELDTDFPEEEEEVPFGFAK